MDKDRLLAAARALGFEIVGPEKRHERLGVERLAVKGGRNLDIFAGRISYDFYLSELCGRMIPESGPSAAW